MKRVILFLFLFPSLILKQGSAGQWKHIITIQENNNSCLRQHNESNITCADINTALKAVQTLNTSILIEVSPGNHTLKYGDNNHITHKTSLTITGSDMMETIVNCEPLAGLYISYSSDITIDGIMFNNCGYRLDSVSQPASVTIQLSSNILLNSVTISKSNGSGIVLDDSLGNVIVDNVTIINGRGTIPMIGGGLVIIDQQNEAYYYVSGSNISGNDYYGAAVTIINLPFHGIYIDACDIHNNNRALFVNNNPSHSGGILTVSESVMEMNWNYSVVVTANSAIRINLDDVDINDTFIIDQQRKVHKPSACALFTESYAKTSCGLGTCNFPSFSLRSSCNVTELPLLYLPGTCSNDLNVKFDGHCPVPYSTEASPGCWDNHDGPLCGGCLPNHSVAINSPHLSCSLCNDTNTVIRGWALLVVFEFIPVTVMVALIALLNVNLNQGSLKSFIFFCQIISIPFPSVSYPSWFVTGYNYDVRYRNFILLPLSIWNLGFINYPSCNEYFESCSSENLVICISQNTTALGAISFWYLIAFYPLLLLVLIYCSLNAYNRGNRLAVFFIRPIHRFSARFWRLLEIQPSFTHTIASVYTLCFTQLAATSLKLLHATSYYDHSVFYYDGSQRYFHGRHGAAGTLALIVLIVFIIVPVVYLFVYPFKWFQKCLNKLHIRKDLLMSVTDAFNAPYKNGIQTSRRDYRWFASFSYTFQLLIMMLYYLTYNNSKIILGLEIGIGLISIIVLFVVRPYKRRIHLFTELIILGSLVVISTLFFIFAFQQSTSGVSIYFAALTTSLFVIALYMVVAVGYCVLWLTRKINICLIKLELLKKAGNQVASNKEEIDKDTDVFADRVLNPLEYK